MNSHCGICDVEKQCGYEYKPCDCCNYRKFKPKESPIPDNVINLKGRWHDVSDTSHQYGLENK